MSERVPGCCDRARDYVKPGAFGSLRFWEVETVGRDLRGDHLIVWVEVTRCPYCGAALPKEEK